MLNNVECFVVNHRYERNIKNYSIRFHLVSYTGTSFVHSSRFKITSTRCSASSIQLTEAILDILQVIGSPANNDNL